MFKRVFTLSVLALQLGAVCAAAPVRHATVREVYDGTMTSDMQVNTFRHIEKLFPVRVVKHGAPVQPSWRWTG